MIQDVKLGAHAIGTYIMYAISKCAFLFGFSLAAFFLQENRQKVK